MPPSAFHLPEIRNYIAEHLSKKELLACCRVSRDWHSSFLPHLWRTVDFNGAGPIFSNSDHPDPRVANIRRLTYNYSTFEGLMPTQGYTRLQELQVLREVVKKQKLAQTGSKGGCAVDRWHLPAALVHSLAFGPLSSVELTSIDKASTEFWEALSQCRTLKSFRLEKVCIPMGGAGPAFWKICRSVETLTVILCKAMDCLLIHNRMFRLKHLVVDRSVVHGQLDEWDKLAKPWVCSPNLESLEYSYSSTSYGRDEFHEMVLDIKAAIAAAAGGINHYAPSSDQGTDEDDENMEQYRGLIPGRKLHSLETVNNGIRDEDLGFIIDNMDTLRKLCVPWNSFGALALEALGWHRHTIVELDLQCDGINSSQLLNTVMSCTQLQVLTLCNIAYAALLESEPWACLQLKRLAFSFQRLGGIMYDPQGAKIASKSRAVWQRISRLTELEHVDVDPYGNWGPEFRPDFTLASGMEQLSTLTKLRCIYIDLVKLAMTDAEWMVGAWPRLEIVRGQNNRRCDHARIDSEVVKIHIHIAEHLPREALLACCRVSKAWHTSFFPYLWRSVVFNGAGPIFSNPDHPDPRVANIRRLTYNYSAFEGPMPTHGYTRLTHLEIRRERNHIEQNLIVKGSKGGCAVNLWHLLTALVQSLAGGPLSSLKMTNVDQPPAEFWEAVVQCRRQLKSFHLDGVYFRCRDSGLWKVCQSVESLDVTLSEPDDCLFFYTRMFRLRHLVLEWEGVLPWLCLPNLETLKYSNCSPSMHKDEFHEMVEDIKAAIAAAAEGRNHYEAATFCSSSYGDDGVGEDMEQYCGLIPGRKLHSLETDRCIKDEDLDFFIANMKVLRKLCMSGALIGTATIAALDRHRFTVMELSLTCDSINTAAVMSAVMGLMQLETLTLESVDTKDFVQSGPWASLRLKQLSISFQTLKTHSSAKVVAASQAIWRRISRLTTIEDLNAYGAGYLVSRFLPVFTIESGLDQLRKLKELRWVEVDLKALAVTEAEWMIGAWPKLKVVRRRFQLDCEDVDKRAMQALADTGITVETLPRFPLRL
ncbi:hypothetical protein BGZ74_008105 [Mortierella antarctica]|nr:hypothetical protein BGZ74_008105 [Mortierella antarctica]